MSRKFFWSILLVIFLFLPALAWFSLSREGRGREKAPGRAKGNPEAEMLFIPAGEFLMGTDKAREEPLPAAYGLPRPPYEDEGPLRKVYVAAFYLDRFEVTVSRYRRFLESTGYPPPYYWENLDLSAYANYPIANISWNDAQAYARWAGKRLPTEAEWEKAARGTEGRRFPWGNEYDERKGNFSQEGLSPVGSFPQDVSPAGVYDMGGNVAEWTADWYLPYPGNTAANEDFGRRYRVFRGGAWGGGTGHYNLSYFARCAYRGFAEPEITFAEVGFRCAKSP